MSEPKLHHYVPRFYLKNFLNNKSRLWVFDKTTGKTFPTTENSVAAENQFYRLPKPVPDGVDPLVIEKNLAAMESSAATIINKLIADIEVAELGGRLEISKQDRIILSEFISAQYYRTLEFYDLLPFLLSESESESKSDLDVQALSEEKRKLLHFYFLANSGCIENFTNDLFGSIWIFARNSSSVQLMTSDHPVSIKNFDNTMWLKGIAGLNDGEYVVYPLSPKIVMYCKDGQRWSGLKEFDQTVSLIELDEDMVHHENAGQCFMSTSFLISQSDNFDEVKNFIPSIGTELYSRGTTPKQGKSLQRTLKYNANRKPGAK